MGQQARILAVDDEPLIRALVTIALEAEGYDVDTAADGAEALAKACQQPPQAIVLDLMKRSKRPSTCRRTSTKPFDIDRLVATVSGLVEAKR